MTRSIEQYKYVLNGNKGVIIWECPEFFWEMHYDADTGEYLGQMQPNSYYGNHPEEPEFLFLKPTINERGERLVNDKLVPPLDRDTIHEVLNRES